MPYTALTGLINSEQLPEYADYLINEALEAVFMATAITARCWDYNLVAGVAFAVMIVVFVVACRGDSQLCSENYTAYRTLCAACFAGFSAGCRCTGYCYNYVCFLFNCSVFKGFVANGTFFMLAALCRTSGVQVDYPLRWCVCKLFGCLFC